MMLASRWSRAAVGATLVIVSCGAVQGSAAISSSLFGDLGVAAVAAWRQGFGALVLLLVVRPRLRNRSGQEWVLIAALALSMAAMNTAFYHAVDLLPLGIAATLLFLGPFLLATLHTRPGWQLLLPPTALVGVAMIGRGAPEVSISGIAIGLLAASALSSYTLISQRLGRAGGLDTLALAVAGSFLTLSPFTIATSSDIAQSQWIILAISGVVGVAIAFCCDFTALRLIGVRPVATLFALDPAIGAIAGAILLTESLNVLTATGIACVVLAGAVTTATTRLPATQRD